MKNLWLTFCWSLECQQLCSKKIIPVLTFQISAYCSSLHPLLKTITLSQVRRKTILIRRELPCKTTFLYYFDMLLTYLVKSKQTSTTLCLPKGLSVVGSVLHTGVAGPRKVRPDIGLARDWVEERLKGRAGRNEQKHQQTHCKQSHQRV